MAALRALAYFFEEALTSLWRSRRRGFARLRCDDCGETPVSEDQTLVG